MLCYFIFQIGVQLTKDNYCPLLYSQPRMKRQNLMCDSNIKEGIRGVYLMPMTLKLETDRADEYCTTMGTYWDFT